MSAVIITPVSDDGKISQQSFLVAKVWWKEMIKAVFGWTRNGLALVGLLSILWWWFL